MSKIATPPEDNNGYIYPCGEIVFALVLGHTQEKLATNMVNGATYYPLTDVQGTVWGYADANNSIVARFEYDAWGNILSAASSVPALATNRYRFQCREWSAATGLINFRARWYDPVMGRWLSAKLLNDLKKVGR